MASAQDQPQGRSPRSRSLSNAPITDSSDLAEASLQRIRDQIRFELQEVKAENRFTQEKLAHLMGYGSGSQLSKILKGTADLSRLAAVELDKNDVGTVLGVTYHQLREALETALSRAPERRLEVRNGKFDVFLAVPMASTENVADFDRVREGAKELSHVLRNRCNYSVYCGILDIERRNLFDSPVFALNENFPALSNSRNFVLWVTELVKRPSSIWVEAGAALALRKPSTYLASGPSLLPYILRQAAEADLGSAYGPVHAHWLSEEQSAASLVQRHGRKLFGE